LAEAAPEVLVVGSLHLDILVKAAHLPIIDETARGSSWQMACGGKGGNQAAWAARFGARTAMISRVGDDDFGKRLTANLRASGVNTDEVAIDRAAGSGMSVAILDANGDYGAVIVSGANLEMTADEALRSLARLGPLRVLVLQNEIEERVNLAVAEAAREQGALVILNAAPAREMDASLADAIDVLVVNRVEAAMMSGRAVSSRDDAKRAIPALRAFGRQVIVTLGGEGLVVARERSEPEEVTPQNVAVKSTHGAGDCFVGRLAAALAQGSTLQDAAVLANVAAAAHVAGKPTSIES
jgi:ribokinase